jgi:polyferredoxin
VTYRNTRRIYQIVFFSLFVFLLTTATMGLVDRFHTNLFLDMSALSGLATILSQHNLAGGMIIGVAIAAMTLFVGRFFCGWICPMGACQQAASYLLKSSDKKELYAKNTYNWSQKIKYLMLLVFVVCAAFGVLLSGYLDPISLLTRVSATIVRPILNLLVNGGVSQTAAFDVTALTGAIFIAVTIMNLRQPRFWCRTICPLGALLGLFSRKPLLRMVRDEHKCIHCGLCRQQCQGACEIDKTLIPSECVMCMNCIDVCPVRAIEFQFAHAVDAAKAANEDARDSSPKVSLNRRDFLLSAVVAVFSIGVLRNFKNVLTRGYEKRIRPPGSLVEEDFLARCVRCGQCMTVCPTNVIQPAKTETDLEGLWTPILNMNAGYCNYDCTSCSQVCPTQAIRPISVEEKHEKGFAKIGTAFIDPGRCLPWAFGETCLVCQEVCPVSPKAIFYQTRSFQACDGKTLSLHVPVIDSQACIGCGACQYNCPVQDLPAIRVTSIGEFRSPDRKLNLKNT